MRTRRFGAFSITTRARKTAQKDIDYIYATGNHPFWVKEVGWVALAGLEPGQILEFQDGTEAVVWLCYEIYCTPDEDVGFMVTLEDEKRGIRIDFSKNFADISPGDDCLTEHYQPNNPFLHRRVFNIEVEGFHTYYVGTGGLWVHNTNCSGSRSLHGCRLFMPCVRSFGRT